MDVRDETASLISTEKVSGTPVYNAQGERVGEIDDIMLDKISGKVAYAVMSFGGFLGVGEQHHPLPWSLLRYDSSLGGYVVNLDKRQLEGAPAYDVGADPGWGNRSYEEKIYAYYKTPPYWGVM